MDAAEQTSAVIYLVLSAITLAMGIKVIKASKVFKVLADLLARKETSANAEATATKALRATVVPTENRLSAHPVKVSSAQPVPPALRGTLDL